MCVCLMKYIFIQYFPQHFMGKVKITMYSERASITSTDNLKSWKCFMFFVFVMNKRLKEKCSLNHCFCCLIHLVTYFLKLENTGYFSFLLFIPYHVSLRRKTRQNKKNILRKILIYQFVMRVRWAQCLAYLSSTRVNSWPLLPRTFLFL